MNQEISWKSKVNLIGIKLVIEKNEKKFFFIHR